MTDVHVRPARPDDRAAIVRIYNHYVETSHVTFDTEPWTVATRAPWFAQFAETGRHRLLVAEGGDAVVGYAYSAPVRPRPAYDTSVEVTVYVAHDQLGRGVGAALYERLFADLAGEDIHRLYAVVALPHAPSIALHERFGFREAGRFSEQGRKFGRYWDVVWLERRAR